MLNFRANPINPPQPKKRNKPKKQIQTKKRIRKKTQCVVFNEFPFFILFCLIPMFRSCFDFSLYEFVLFGIFDHLKYFINQHSRQTERWFIWCIVMHSSNRIFSWWLNLNSKNFMVFFFLLNCYIQQTAHQKFIFFFNRMNKKQKMSAGVDFTFNNYSIIHLFCCKF